MSKIVTILWACNKVFESDCKEINYVKDRLINLNYEVNKVAPVLYKETVLLEELESSIKQCDILILISPFIKRTLQVIADLFHQNLIYNENLQRFANLKERDAYMPKHMKVLQPDVLRFPIFYIQGLILLPDDFNELKLSIDLIEDPFLSDFSKKPIYKRKLLMNNKDHHISSIIDSKINITYDIKENYFDMNISSDSLSALLEYEASLKEMSDNIIRSETDDSITQLIYNQKCPHIRQAIECIEECFKRYEPENVFLSFNGGKDCTVLLHLTLGVLQKFYPCNNKPLCVYIENKVSFQKLNQFILQCQQYYGLDVLKLSKSIKDSLAYIVETKTNMKACLMGTRRTDPFSENLQTFQMTDHDWPQLMRVNPLLDWHYSDIWDYLLYLKVPYCSLYDMGYTSLGGVTNTIRNPYLILNNKDGTAVYLPAHKLLDASKERSGRS